MGEVVVVMILSSEPGVQASAPGDPESSSQGAFVQVNGHPGKVGCVYQGMTWSWLPFPALAVTPSWGATSWEQRGC